MIRTRLLPRDEWPAKLAATDLGPVHPTLPAGAQIVVIEDGDTLIGTWAVYPQVTVHGCWIAPAQRGNGVAFRHLYRGMQQTALAMGATAVQTSADDPTVAGMLEKLGAVDLPGRHFALGLGLRVRKDQTTIDKDPPPCL